MPTQVALHNLLMFGASSVGVGLVLYLFNRRRR